MARRPQSARYEQDLDEQNPDESLDLYDDDCRRDDVCHRTIRGPPLEYLVNICREPPFVKDMQDIRMNNCVFMIRPFKYNPHYPNEEPMAINHHLRYIDAWNEHHVRMPCSPSYIGKDGHARWPIILQFLLRLKQKCDNGTATVEDLKRTIEVCAERNYNMNCLEYLINEIYSNERRAYFMTRVLSNMCTLASNVDILCSRPPPLLRINSNVSVTMSQRQTASLLACAFFCLFPYRSGSRIKKEYENFQNPNFNTLYQRGGPHKIEKIKCILHYFSRITERMPVGVITFRRYALPEQFSPRWSKSEKGLTPMHLTTSKRIEDVDCCLQVDFANKYIGGGVLNSGCVQEEIRFTICPEMLVSLLVCEVLEPNECVFLIGCERYSAYKGYSNKFQYGGDFIDNKPKDNWGRKWNHLVAMDALYFRDPLAQYNMKSVKRELIKAYSAFYTRGKTPNEAFPVVTGNWGCGAFNGDKQLKALIQLIAASETMRPLIYATYGDKNLVENFSQLFDYLISQRAKVRDLYRYIDKYISKRPQTSLFNYILHTPVVSLHS